MIFPRRGGHPLNAKTFKSFHYRHILIIPLRGGGEVMVNAETFWQEPGRCLLIRPYQFHYYTNVNVEGIDWLFIGFEGNIDTGGVPALTVIEAPQFWSDLQALIETYLEPESALSTMELSCRLMLLLKQLQKARGLDAQQPKKLNADEDLLLRFHALMAQRMHVGMSIGEVSAALGISESHLRSRFRHAVGRSLGSFMLLLRLRRAAWLLSREDMRVGQVAAACGWESPYSFSRAFTKHWGVSPRGFSKLNSIPRENINLAKNRQPLP